MVTRCRYALDANVLVSIVNSHDPQHFSCYSFFRNINDGDKARWVVPGLIFFEFQATQSKLSRKQRTREKPFRWAPLHYENTELYQVTKKFLIKAHELDLYNKFCLLKGADLLYGCIAYIEGIPLVTHDRDFDPYSNELTIIRPCEFYGTDDVPLYRGTVKVEKNGRMYKAGYEVFRGVVRLETGQATHFDGANAKFTARLLLREIVESGLAYRLNLHVKK